MPLQNPIEASGPLPGVFATPSEGPHFPCAAKGGTPPFNGQQIPCDDGSSKSLTHTRSPDNLTVRIRSFNPEPNPNPSPNPEPNPNPNPKPEPTPDQVYISNFNIEEVPLMSFGAFQVKFKYTATGSDRYAVHPCTINLYDTGKGVGANGKLLGVGVR